MAKKEDEKKAEDAPAFPPTVEEIEAAAEAKAKAEAKKAPPPVHPRVAVYGRLREELRALEEAVRALDTVLIARVVRYANTVRRRVDREILERLVREFVPAAPSSAQAFLLELLSSAPPPPKDEEEEEEEDKGAVDVEMKDAGGGGGEEEGEKSEKKEEKKKKKVVADFGAQPAERPAGMLETEAFLQLLVGLLLLDAGQAEPAARAFTDAVQRVPAANRRSLDLLAARAYFYYTLCRERKGRLRGELPFLLASHRTACLHHDEPSQTVLTNAVLRLYLRDSLYAQADKFRLNTKLPESASANQVARHLYYTGRINAVQLHYSDAKANLEQALRKGPQNGAKGFRLQAQKLLCLVQLLMGDIPERSVFRDADLGRALLPYFKLTHAVHVGSLADFKAVQAKFHAVFAADKNHAIILRLRQNVIKTGLRKINLSYSRISLADVRAKLLLDTVEAAEFVVAKAIHDGVIDATIDHATGIVYSKENMDVYSTREPQNAFHSRIEFCNLIHNGAVKALRFPAKPGKGGAADTADADEERKPAPEPEDLDDLEGDDEVADEDM